MPGDRLRRVPQLTLEQFHAFRDERPTEKWELIDGGRRPTQLLLE